MTLKLTIVTQILTELKETGKEIRISDINRELRDRGYKDLSVYQIKNYGLKNYRL